MKNRLKPNLAVYPCPVMVIGSHNGRLDPNLMVASWVGHASISPPLLTVCLRPETLTHRNIEETGVFTVSVPRSSQAGIVDLLGTVSGKKRDKFQLAGLTLARTAKMRVPYAEEFPVVMECLLSGKAGLGSHTMFIGEVTDLLVDAALPVEEKSGLPWIEAVDPLMLSVGGMVYRSVGPQVGLAFRMARMEKGGSR